MSQPNFTTAHNEITGRILAHVRKGTSFTQLTNPDAAIWRNLHETCTDNGRRFRFFDNLSKKLNNTTPKDIEKWADAVFPKALTPSWLNTQLEKKRIGLLVQAYRTRRGMGEGDLASLVGASVEEVQSWEGTNGALTKIPAEKYEKLKGVFSQDPLFNEQNFVETYEKSSRALTPVEVPKKSKPTLRAVETSSPVPTVDYAEEPTKILVGPAKKQRAGLFYAAWAKKHKVGEAEIAATTGLSGEDVKAFLRGDMDLPEDKVEPALQLLTDKTSDVRVNAFRDLCVSSRLARSRETAPSAAR